MKTYAVDEEGKYSVVARNKKALLVPKKVAADKYPVQSIDKFCYRKNYDYWDVEFLLIPEEENAISFPYRENIRPAIRFRKTNRVFLMNTKK